jgi:hypothetical protein
MKSHSRSVSELTRVISEPVVRELKNYRLSFCMWL